MGYFADGFFTGALASVKETGRKLKNGAKELVEDFISGFNGHGWKLWKRGDSWRLELDELMVRKSFQVFELIINQITAIKGSQAITQGHAKIKDVTIVESADVYKETTVDPNFYYNSRDWRNPYQTGDIPEVVATTDTISTTGSVTESQAWVVRKGTKIPAKTVQITVNSTLAKMRYTYSDAAGINRIMEITESGTYNLPESTGKLADNGFFFDTGFNGEIKQTLLPLETTEEIVQEPCYRIQIDDELNSITEYDLIRCQKGNKFYYVQVGSVFQYYINIPTSEFEANEEGIVLNAPAAGDEIVQFGNASHQEKYANRHSAIYLHVDEDEPAIDLMTDIYSKDWSVGNILKTRLGGNLPGTDGERGFYCVNGKLLFVDENGDTVSVINPDGSASFARGQISWAKDGNPYFRGYIIAGDAKGKRIEINPNNASVEVYDENNKEVISLEGNNHSLIDFWGGTTPILNITNLIGEKPITLSSGSPTKTWNLVSDFIVPNDSSYLTYSTIIGYIIQGDGTFDYLKLDIYLIKIQEDLKEEKTALESLNVQGPAATTDINIPITIRIPKGKYRIDVEYNFRKTAIIGVENKSVLDVEISAHVTDNTYLASIFSNGLVLGDSSDNFFSVINEKNFTEVIGAPDNALQFNLFNPYGGLKLEEGTVKIRHRTYWSLINCTIMSGKVYGIGAMFRGRTWNGEFPTINQLSTGLYKIEYPESWNSLILLTQTSIDVFVTGYNMSGGKEPLIVNVYEISSTGVTVKCINYNGVATNIGAFFIEIRYGS